MKDFYLFIYVIYSVRNTTRFPEQITEQMFSNDYRYASVALQSIRTNCGKSIFSGLKYLVKLVI